jgi:hypothetical protein
VDYKPLAASRCVSADFRRVSRPNIILDPPVRRRISYFCPLKSYYSLLDKTHSIQKEERAILVGLVQKDQTDEQVQEYMEELSFLAETAGAVTMKRFTQKLQHPDSKTFVGKGKLEEIKTYITLKEIQVVIFDDELSGSQISNIEKILDTKVIDRSDLILDIFACPGEDGAGQVAGRAGSVSIYSAQAAGHVESPGTAGGRYRDEGTG